MAEDAKTHWLFAGDGVYDSASGWTYHLARWRDGFRFTSFDSFEADPSSPAALHKYLYASGDPVVVADATGHWGYIQSLATVGALGVAGGITGAVTKTPQSFLEGFIPGWGAGRGLGAAIAKGDVFGMVINTAFLGLDLLTFGGASYLAGTAKAGMVSETVSKELVEALYESVQQVIKKPEFLERIGKLGFGADDLPKLAEAIKDYYLKGHLGYSASKGTSWAGKEAFVLTEQAAKDWKAIAHELTHVLDDLASPGLFEMEAKGAISWMKTVQVESRAFTVQYGSKLVGGGLGFLQSVVSQSVAGGVNLGFGALTVGAKLWDWMRGKGGY